MSAPEVQFRQCSAGPAHSADASNDAATLALVGAATFLEAFAGRLPGDAILGHCRRNHTEAAYAHYLAQPATRAWVAEAMPGAAPIGYALVTAPEFAPELLQPGDTELKRIYVFSRFYAARQPTESGPAPGQRLMNLAIEQARADGHKRLLLGTHRENTRAIAFYLKNAFETIGTRTFQVGPSIFDDLVLARTL